MVCEIPINSVRINDKLYPMENQINALYRNQRSENFLDRDQNWSVWHVRMYY